MHLREYLHPRARSCSGRRVSSPPPTATFPRLPTPREHGLRAAKAPDTHPETPLGSWRLQTVALVGGELALNGGPRTGLTSL